MKIHLKKLNNDLTDFTIYHFQYLSYCKKINTICIIVKDNKIVSTSGGFIWKWQLNHKPSDVIDNWMNDKDLIHYY